MTSFIGCMIGTFIGNLVYDLLFNKEVDIKVQKNFDKRWFD